MPNYTYECKSCDKIFELFLSVKRIDEPIDEKCPLCSEKKNIRRIITQIRIGDPILLGVKKADPRLRENLKRMKEHHKNSTINI